MDAQRFDALARAMASGSTRRQTLRLAGGGLAGALLAAVGLAEAAAQDLCKPPGARCRRGGDCCSGLCRKRKGATRGRCRDCPSGTKPCAGSCIPAGDCCTAADCTALSGQTCQGGVCACPPGTAACAGTCCAGCCDVERLGGTMCVPGTAPAACGTGGQVCQACPRETRHACTAGVCVPC